MNSWRPASHVEVANSQASGGPVLVSPRRVLIGIVVVAGVFGIAHMVIGGILFAAGSPRNDVANLLDLNREGTPATWFSAVLLLTAAVLIGVLRATSTGPDRWRWTVLGLLCVLASVDEVSQFHELLLSDPLRGRFGAGPLAPGWVLPVGIGVAAVALLFVSWLYRQRRPAGRFVVLGAGVYLLGALGLEMFEGWWQTVGGVGSSSSTMSAVFYVATGVEEVLEMLGAGLVVYGLLTAVGQVQAKVGVRRGATGGRADAGPRPST